MKNSALLYIAILGLLTCSCKSSTEKVAYVMNQKVFDSFSGTKETKASLSRQESLLKKEIDSLFIEIKLNQTIGNALSKKKLNQAQERYNSKLNEYQKLGTEGVQTLNEQIWIQINQYVGEYGKQNGYTFIYGANGSGTIMYADSSKDVTNDVVKYINKKYAGE